MNLCLGSAFCTFPSGAFFVCGSHALFTGPASTFLAKTTLKLDPTTLFTYLKIILLQCFQFSVISGIQTDLKSRL